MEHKVVFMDRDGVINKRVWDNSKPFVAKRENFVLSWADFKWIPGSRGAIGRLLDNEYVVVVVSNQACVGYEFCTTEELEDLMRDMWWHIKKPERSRYHAYLCPHTPKDDCVCRKPKPGLIYAAAFTQGLRLKEAWMVGDSRSDMQAGWRAGIRKLILIDDKDKEFKALPRSRRVARPAKAYDLSRAVDYILNMDRKKVSK